MNYSMEIKLKKNNYNSILERINHYVRRKSNFSDTLPTKDALFALEMSYGAATNDIIEKIGKLKWNKFNEAYGYKQFYNINEIKKDELVELYFNDKLQAEYNTVEEAKEAAEEFNKGLLREEINRMDAANG